MNDDLQILSQELLKKTYFLTNSFTNYSKQNYIWTPDSIKTTNGRFIQDIIEFCTTKTDVIDSYNITLSTEHKKESFDILNIYIDPILKETNVDFIFLYGTAKFYDLFKSYFNFYKKFNDIKFEWNETEDNKIFFYDHKPIAFIIDKITKIANYNINQPWRPSRSPNFDDYLISFQWQKELHTSILLNINDNPKRLERKLKIEQLSLK